MNRVSEAGMDENIMFHKQCLNKCRGENLHLKCHLNKLYADLYTLSGVSLIFETDSFFIFILRKHIFFLKKSLHMSYKMYIFNV